MNQGQELWNRALKVIPNGNMLLSKNPDRFLPGIWPTYYSKASGVNIWNLEGQKFLDMSLMGVGTNLLGYGDKHVDQAVTNSIKLGNLSTFNCPEEVYLAERLIEIHPWASMVKFARTGGEANSIALRIARAASGRDSVAICGYHGWHDWYLSANLTKNDNLNQHLLPGLNPKGVPASLKDTTHSFSYNNLEQLENLIKTKNIGVIFMEVMRNFEPKDGFLNKVRKIATENNIVLIFDECSSGFRETFGGLHLKYNVEPDIAMFGKALGNGYSITAIIGKKEIMEAAQDTFISSTFWTERIGYVAALKTLERMEELKSWKIVTKKGNYVKSTWEKLAKQFKLDIDIRGLAALSTFNFNSKDSIIKKTFITQEMLKKGILSSNSIYISTEHKSSHFERYFNELSDIFNFISKKENIEDYIDYKPCSADFKRLN